jgi:drug/metabolite transporter (DMT)-like permease
LPFFVWCLLSAIWGSTWLFIRVGVRDLPPFGFAGLRFLIASIALWIVFVSAKRSLPNKAGEWRFIALSGLVIISLQYGMIFWAEVYIPSGLTAILYTVMPLFGMVYAHWLVPGETMSLTKTMGVVLGIVGVALVFSDQLRVSGHQALLACGAVLFAAITNALAIVMVKIRGRGIDSLALTVGQMSIGFVPLLTLGLVREGSPLDYHWTLMAWLSLFYLALVGSALAFVLLYWLIKRMDVTKTQLIPIASVLVAVVLGRVVLDEALSPLALAGGAAILGGLLLTRWGFRATRA